MAGETVNPYEAFALPANPYEAFTNPPAAAVIAKDINAQPTFGEYAADTAKSAGIGIPKATISLLGSIGDAGELGTHLSAWLLDQHSPGLGTDALQWMKEKGVSPAELVGFPPSSSEIRKGVENITGSFYEPKTTPGKYAQTVAELAPIALAGPSGIAVNLARGAVAPGIAAEYLGQTVEGTPLEPWARLIGALGGGAGAIAAGKGIAEPLANRAATGSAAGELGVPAGAVSRVGKSFAADELTPSAVAARQAELGPEAMFLDMGRQLQGRAEAIASQPGKGQNRVLKAVEGRTGDYGDQTAARIKDTLDAAMGPSVDIVAAKNRIGDLVDAHARPLYQRVMTAHPVVDVPADITARPAVAGAMNNAETLARQYGESPAKPSLQYWDYVKKDMDRRINAYYKSGGTSELNSADKADLGGLLDARRSLVDHLDSVTGGAYKNARHVAAAKPQIQEAIDFGRSALNTKLLPEELAEQVSGMSLPEQAGVKAGMRREVERIIDTARNDGAAARRVLDTNQNGDKIGYVFGPQARKALEDRIAAETQFQKATADVAGSSRTAVRRELVKDTEAPAQSAPPSTTLLGLGHAALRGTRGYLGDLALERTREGIADLVTRSGGDIPTLARVLSNYNTARAANAAIPIGPQARSLSAIIASQTPGWLLAGPQAP